MSNIKPENFDIVLIYSAFQRNCIYSQLIKYLSKNLKIGIFVIENNNKRFNQKEISKTNIDMIDFLKSLGAIEINSKINTKLIIISQSNFSKESIQKINNSIISKKIFLLSGLAMGTSFHNHLKGLKIDKILVPDINLFYYRINNYEKKRAIIYSKKNIIEIGINYNKYPVIDLDRKIDYIIAAPSPFSFHNRFDILDFLKNVNNFLDTNTKSNDVIAYKQHNAELDNDYLIKNYYLKLLFFCKFIFINKFINNLCISLYKLNYRKLNNFIVELLIAFEYKHLMEKTISFSSLTKYANFNIDIFLPFVEKGLITGRSNTIWHALNNNLPVWNCVDKKKKYFSNKKMHKKTMEYLNINGNYKEFLFDLSKFNIIKESTRKADIIEIIKKEIYKIKSH